VIKIITNEKDLEKGDNLKGKITAELKNKGFTHTPRHTALYSSDMPIIDRDLKLSKNDLNLTLWHESKSFPVCIEPAPDEESVRLCLSFLFGEGFAHYDYSHAIFHKESADDIIKYKSLAVEIWERDIHIKWMHDSGFPAHNGSKDYKFLFDMINHPDNPLIAANDHNLRSDRGDKGDTPHHSLREYRDFIKVLELNGEHPMTGRLVEMIYDQATATVRMWYNFRAEPFDKRLDDNIAQGIYFKGARWKLDTDKITKTYLAKKTWQDWFEIHEKFRIYWKNKFGKKEELWQPPTLYVVKGSKYALV
jgi:hypothetical protein